MMVLLFLCLSSAYLYVLSFHVFFFCSSSPVFVYFFIFFEGGAFSCFRFQSRSNPVPFVFCFCFALAPLVTAVRNACRVTAVLHPLPHQPIYPSIRPLPPTSFMTTEVARVAQQERQRHQRHRPPPPLSLSSSSGCCRCCCITGTVSTSSMTSTFPAWVCTTCA